MYLSLSSPRCDPRTKNNQKGQRDARGGVSERLWRGEGVSASHEADQGSILAPQRSSKPTGHRNMPGRCQVQGMRGGGPEKSTFRKSLPPFSLSSAAQGINICQ